MSLPLPLRIFIPVLLLLFAVLMGINDIWYRTSEMRQQVETQALDQLTERMTRMQGSFEFLLRNQQMDQLRSEVSSLGTDVNLRNAFISDDKGDVLASINFSDVGRPAQKILALLQDADQSMRKDILGAVIRGGDARVYLSHDRQVAIGVYPVLIGAERGALRPTRLGLFYMQQDLSVVKALQERAIKRAALEKMAYWGALATLLWVFSYYLITRRMFLLLDVARRFAAGDKKARSALRGRDELAAISVAFDQMAARLEENQTRLEQGKERLDVALRSARMCTWEFIEGNDTVTWSDNFGELLLGAPLRGEAREVLAGVLAPVIRQCASDEVEQRIELSDGTERWIACRGEAFEDDTGRLARMTGVIWDVTERRRATDALQALAESRMTAADTAFFTNCVTELASAYGSYIAFIGIFADAEHHSVRTLAVRCGAGLMDNFTYAVAGTPCADVMKCKRELIPWDVQLLYPEDHMLTDLGAESYFGMPLRAASGEVIGLVAVIDTRPMALKPWTSALLGIFADRIAYEIERKQADDSLFEAKERAEVTLHSIGDAVITTDAGGKVDYLNPIAEQLTGWRNDEAQGRPLADVFVIINEITRQAALNPVERCLRDGCIVGLANHTVLIDRNGRETAIEDSAAPIRQRDGTIIGVVMVFHDVSQARAMAQQLTWQATHDTLTGLINRLEFENRLAMALIGARSEQHRHMLLYLDLDQFKIVNDTCGHVAGDELLKQLAGLLQSKMREGDVLARLGGDELGILLGHCPEEQACHIAETLRQTIKEYRFSWEGKIFEIGVSIGMVVVDADSASVAEILSTADMACYAAKDDGRNRIHVYRRGDSDLAQRHGEMQWVSRLTRAVEENRLLLYRQRILSIADPDSPDEHYEILVRLRGEEGEIIAPGAFIPAAERYGLMPMVDRWVIRTLFAAMAQQADPAGCARGNCSYAVNLSGYSLGDESLLAYVNEQLTRHKIAPQRIWFEITETAAIANLPKATRFIQEMKALGCRFSLDDFGSGVSSFAYLKNLAVDNLKIDGSFVKDIVDDPIDYAMVQSINQIGHVMGLRTTAEFVENDAILERLRSIGVDFAQGYGIDRPQPFI